MMTEPERDSCHEYPRVQDCVFARLQPDSEIEERLARRIALCRYSLEQIRNRLTKTWSQLNKIQETFKHDALP